MTKLTQYPPPLLQTTARGVVMGAPPKQQDNSNATMRPNGMTTQQRGMRGKQCQRRWSKWKKAQETSNNTSWAVGEFLFILFSSFLFLNPFSYLLELLMMKVTWHPPPLLWATARRVLHGLLMRDANNGDMGDDKQRGENNDVIPSCLNEQTNKQTLG